MAMVVDIYIECINNALHEDLDIKKIITQWVQSFLIPDQEQKQVGDFECCSVLFRRTTFCVICDFEKGMDPLLLAAVQSTVCKVVRSR